MKYERRAAQVGCPMVEKRGLFRIAIDRTGQVQRGTENRPCRVFDLTEKGFQLGIEGGFHPSEILHLEFSLNESELVACTVQVAYVRPPYLGAVIVGISPDHQAQLSRFVDQLNILSMTGF